VAEVTLPRPLSETDDCGRFDCGRESLNHWFLPHAWYNHAAGVSRTNVICDAATAEIIGYVTLSGAQVERAFLPKSQQRNKPDPVPATLLGQLAIHKDHQGSFARRSEPPERSAASASSHTRSTILCARSMADGGSRICPSTLTAQ
jgi:hypothetical protein